LIGKNRRKIQILRFSTIKTRAKFFDWKKKKKNPKFEIFNNKNKGQIF